MYVTATKTFKVDFSAVADGSGLWGMAEGQEVNFNKLEVSQNYDTEEQEFYGCELRAYHDADANEYGLCYTDDGITAMVKDELKKLLTDVIDDNFYCSGSEQGMQGADYLSCDVNLKETITLKELEHFGFTLEED